ncbi:MAG: dTDP-4-dehydrorhamnose reductase family protein [Thiohalobacterales bacterium]
MKLLVLGASGMLGNAMIRILAETGAHEVFGTVRSVDVTRCFPRKIAAHLLTGIDVEKEDALAGVFDQLNPDVVINCIGLIKQLAGADDPLQAIPLNALLPHRLARLCDTAGARLVHISTDCVFSGEKGGYQEADYADARDLYGMSKFLGEVDSTYSITLRTSIIGHALDSTNGLIDWFLAQQRHCRGYTRAIFSGLPTVVLAQLVRDVIIPDSSLSGLYHVGADRISKFELLELVARVYAKTIEIIPDDSLVIDRSLDAGRFKAATGYTAPRWPELVETMYSDYLQVMNQDHV